jgi:hypothetical protein
MSATIRIVRIPTAAMMEEVTAEMAVADIRLACQEKGAVDKRVTHETSHGRRIGIARSDGYLLTQDHR